MVLRTAIALLAAFGLAACASGDIAQTMDGGFDIPAKGGTVNTVKIVEEADWEGAWTKTLRIRQGEFTPAFMALRAGAPYVLTIENGDDTPHSFISAGFFKAIAVKSLVPADEEVGPGTQLVSLQLNPGESRELSFVPVRDGFYYFEKGPALLLGSLHLTPFGFGMGGAIAIE